MTNKNLSRRQRPKHISSEWKGWLPGGPRGPSIWTAPGGSIVVQGIEPGYLTPEEAREVADVLYAAAEYSEDGETNESSE